MLTGDKLETAENIGYSTNLFNENMHIIKCRGEEDCLKAFNKEEAIKNEKMIKDGVQRGLLIESGALQFILSN
jgi:magnesium-transporting ATPase (P-type)